MLTSNKHVRDWPAIFAEDEILTTAILDRFLHHAEIIQITGKSYRLRHQARPEKDADEQPKTKAPEKSKQATPEGGAQSAK